MAGSGQEQALVRVQEQVPEVWAELPRLALRVWFGQVVSWGRQRAWRAMRQAKGRWLAPRPRFALLAFVRKA